MEREHLRSALKREVRQRCGFGCVMCGSPVFDYEHIEGYGKTGHAPEHMTLLCPEHHREKTAGRLPADIVREANAAPANSANGLSKAHPLYFSGNSMNIELGNVHVETTELSSSVIEIDDEAVLKADVVDGRLVLGMILRDADNRALLVVQKGQLKYAVSSWDITYEGTTLTIRRGPRDVVLRMKLVPPNRLIIERAEWWSHGAFLKVGKSCQIGEGVELVNSNSRIQGAFFKDCRTALGVGAGPVGNGGGAWLGAPIRWLGGIPARAGSFSENGGGQIIA